MSRQRCRTWRRLAPTRARNQAHRPTGHAGPRADAVRCCEWCSARASSTSSASPPGAAEAALQSEIADASAPSPRLELLASQWWRLSRITRRAQMTSRLRLRPTASPLDPVPTGKRSAARPIDCSTAASTIWRRARERPWQPVSAPDRARLGAGRGGAAAPASRAWSRPLRTTLCRSPPAIRTRASSAGYTAPAWRAACSPRWSPQR